MAAILAIAHDDVIKWRHFARYCFCAGNSPVPREFPSQRQVTRNFDIFVDQHVNKQLSKQSRRWWFETQSHPLWRHCNAHISCCSWGLWTRAWSGVGNINLLLFYCRKKWVLPYSRGLLPPKLTWPQPVKKRIRTYFISLTWTLGFSEPPEKVNFRDTFHKLFKTSLLKSCGNSFRSKFDSNPLSNLPISWHLRCRGMCIK